MDEKLIFQPIFNFEKKEWLYFNFSDIELFLSKLKEFDIDRTILTSPIIIVRKALQIKKSSYLLATGIWVKNRKLHMTKL